MTSPPFEPRMSNIPLWNLREEFYRVNELINSEQFPASLRQIEPPIRTPMLDWYGEERDLLSLLVQRALLGVESYTIGAAWAKLIALGRMTGDLNKKVRNPFSIKARAGTAAAYYQHLPELIHPNLGIPTIDQEFWIQLKDFYKNVRNPLFHGSQFESGDIQNAIRSFWIIQGIYNWIDQWYDSGWTPGKRQFFALRLNA